MNLEKPCWIVRKFRGRSAGQHKFFQSAATRQLIAIRQLGTNALQRRERQQESCHPHQVLLHLPELVVSQQSSHAALFAIPRLQQQTVFAAIAKSAQSKTVAHNK